ncbi:hypothetical protein [Marinobacter salarius]|uniref:hypothetical protein n=1 Tax=Marinobacter salarius TaxID=1420917 RepID=UPI000F88FF4A|nr:hypothetical protein [Marinobacter salarius]
MTIKLRSHDLLKAVVEAREISLADLEPLIDSKFGDYRDYYSLAMLCTDGYIKCDWSSNGEPVTDELSLASIFYASATGQQSVNSFIASSAIDPERSKFFTAPKGELYFAEARAKRSDRIYAMAIGIVVGVCTAILAVQLGLK